MIRLAGHGKGMAAHEGGVSCPRRRIFPGVPAGIALVLVLPAGGLAGLLLVADAGAAAALPADPYVLRVVRFTLLQAGLSAVLSLIVGTWLGHALFRQGDAVPGWRVFRRLLLLPFALPQLVAVLGLLAVWGRGGWVNDLLESAGVGRLADIYGLAGILLAHVFYNAPLVARLVLLRLEGMPAEYLRLAAQLGMPREALWRLVVWPLVREVLPGAAVLVFMLCAGSFTVVLVLGGGPGATTLEVAIYQSLRFDFAPARAVVLAVLQLVLAAALFLMLRRLAPLPDITAGLGRGMAHPHRRQAMARLVDGLALGVMALFLGLPLVAVVMDGLRADLIRLLGEPEVREALVRSLQVALTASGLVLAVVMLMLPVVRGERGNVRSGAWPVIADAAASLVLVISPVILAAGWFVLIIRANLAEAITPWLVAGINALMALPFAWRALMPAAAGVERRYGRLCAQLNLTGSARWRLVDGPLLARPAGAALAMTLALSLGDLGVVALLGSDSFRTLPLLIYQRLGSYRTADAAGLSLLLMVLVGLLMAAAEGMGRRGGQKRGEKWP
jgi:thiamine transport system permease protein